MTGHRVVGASNSQSKIRTKPFGMGLKEKIMRPNVVKCPKCGTLHREEKSRGGYCSVRCIPKKR